MKKLFILLAFSILCVGMLYSQVKVSYKCGNTSTSVTQIKPYINLINTGSVGVYYDTMKVRYYFTKEGNADQQCNVEYAVIGSSMISGTFYTGYLEITFSSRAGILPVGEQSGEIRLQINKNDWSPYDQSDDYSFDPSKTSYADWGRITVYKDDVLIWGVEPGGGESPVPTETPEVTVTPVITATPTADVTPNPDGYSLNVYTEGADVQSDITYWGDLSGKDTTPFTLYSDLPYTVGMEPGNIDIKEDFTSGFYLWTWDGHSYFGYDSTVWADPVESSSFTIYSSPSKDLRLKFANYDDPVVLPTPLPTPMGTSAPSPPPSKITFVDYETREPIPDSDITVNLIIYNTFQVSRTWNTSEITFSDDHGVRKLLQVNATGYHELIVFSSTVTDYNEPTIVSLYKESTVTPAPENTPVIVLPPTPTPAPNSDAAWYTLVDLLPPEISFTYGDTVQMTAVFSYHHTGFRIINWGVPVIEENTITIDTEIIEWDGAAPFWNTYLHHTYDLGSLTQGEQYTIVYKEWGTTIREVPFTVAPPQTDPDPLEPPWQVYINPTLRMEQVPGGSSTYALLTASVYENNTIAHVVSDWGEVTQNGTEFTVNPVFYRNIEAAGERALHYHSYMYDLGELDIGSYTFRVVTNGTEIYRQDFEIIATFAPLPTIRPLPTTAPAVAPVVRTFLSTDTIAYPETSFGVRVMNYGAPCLVEPHQFLTDPALSISPASISLETTGEATFTVTVDWSQLYGEELHTSYNAFIVTDSAAYREYLPWETILDNRNPTLLSIRGTVDRTEGITVILSGDTTGETIPDSSGNYKFTALKPGGNYTIAVHYSPPPPGLSVVQPLPGETISGIQTVLVETHGSVCDYVFAPEQYTYSELDSDQINQDFTTAAAADCCQEVTHVSYVLENLAYLDETPTMCSGSYSWDADTTQVADGDAELHVVIYDDLHQMTEIYVPVIIDNTGTCPSGDVNGDGVIDIIDALMVAQYYVGLTLEGFLADQGDVDLSGTIDIVDALLIAQYYVGLITEFPGCQ